MEHLLPPGTKVPIHVPYYQQQPDDDGDVTPVEGYTYMFETIVKYHTDEISVAERDFRTREQLALWLDQCCRGRIYNLCHALLYKLYFGLLRSILGPEVAKADFTRRDDDGVTYLTTTALELYLLEWRHRLECSDVQTLQAQKWQYIADLKHAGYVLRHLSWYLGFLYNTDEIDDYIDEEPLGKTHCVCVILHQALLQACKRMFNLRTGIEDCLSQTSQLPWLKRKMKIEGWCPQTLARLYEKCGIDVLLYGSALGSVRTAGVGRHDHCSKNVCVANNVDTEASIRHVQEGCACPTVQVPINDIVQTLRRKEIPVLQVSTDAGPEVSLLVRSAAVVDNSARYIAISHVWADGVGSPGANIIAQCQLVRIAERVRRLRTVKSSEELCIWVDTLCIPVAPQYSEERAWHISRMHRVYKDADAVMVIDSDTLALQPSASPTEICMRLYLSAWSTRLWTYQEGAINARLLVMTMDDVVDVDEIIQTARREEKKNKPLHHDLLEASTERAILFLGRSYFHSEISPALEEIRVKIRGDDDRFDTFAQKLIVAVADRTSSRADDEAVIIGTALQLDVARILAAPPAQRMAVLLRAMPLIPGNLLFALGSRLEEPGLRWAPVSILRSNGGSAFYTVSEYVPISLKRLRHGHFNTRQISALDRRGHGLYTFNPAIHLKRVRKIPPEDHIALNFELFGTTFYFNYVDMNDGHVSTKAQATNNDKIQDMLSEGKILVILLSEFDPKDIIFGRIAVLAEVLSDFGLSYELDPRGTPPRLRYHMAVSITGENSSRPGLLDLWREERRGRIEDTGTGASEVSCLPDADESCWNLTSTSDAEWIESRFWLID